MRIVNRAVLIPVLIHAVLAPVAWAATGGRGPEGKRPTVSELLHKYAETHDKLRSFIVKAQITNRAYGGGGMYPKGTKTVFHKTVELRTDGERCKLIQRRWGHVNKHRPNVPKENATYTSKLWDGNFYYQFSKSIQPGKPGRVFITRGNDPDGLGSLLHGDWAENAYDANAEPLEKTLLEAHNASVRNEMDVVGKAQCYVIDAVTKRGKYTVWIDPAHGYNIAKLVQILEQGDFLNREPLKTGTMSFSTEVRQFKRIDGVWVPWEADQVSRQKAPGWQLTIELHYKRTEFILNPDHDALGSFLPDDIEDQTVVQIGEASYRWLRGAKFVVNAKGQVVKNDPNKPQLPIVKTLPQPKQLNLGSYPESKKDAVILLCFCDINQQLSKRLLRELKERSIELEKKGVSVVLVGRSTGVDAWVKKNGLNFKAGHIDRKFDDWMQRSWGLDKLPWLVLARGRIVTAEGFGPDELDEKIKEAESTAILDERIRPE